MALQAGSRIKIRGLLNNKELNGREGWVVKDAPNNRLGIILDNGSNVIALQPDKLEKIVMMSALRCTADNERHEVGNPPEAICKHIPDKYALPSDEVLPVWANPRVVERILTLVENFCASGGVFVLLDDPELSRIDSFVDEKRTRPDITSLWQELKISIWEDLDDLLLSSWKLCKGAVRVHAKSGVVLDVGCKILEEGISKYRVPGGTKNNTALKCCHECNCIAIVKKLKYYREDLPKLHSVRVFYPPHFDEAKLEMPPVYYEFAPKTLRNAQKPDKCLGIGYMYLPIRLLLALVIVPLLGAMLAIGLSFGVLNALFLLSALFVVLAHFSTSLRIGAPVVEYLRSLLQGCQELGKKCCGSWKFKGKTKLRALVSNEMLENDITEVIDINTFGDIPHHSIPDGVSPLVLLRVLDLAGRLKDDALIVLGLPAYLPLDRFRTHPDRARLWRDSKLSIFMELSDKHLADWSWDGAVIVHPLSGEILDLSVKLLQPNSPRVSASVGGGFKKDAAVKVAALASAKGAACISLCVSVSSEDLPKECKCKVFLCSSLWVKPHDARVCQLKLFADVPPRVSKMICKETVESLGQSQQKNTAKSHQRKTGSVFCSEPHEEGNGAPSCHLVEPPEEKNDFDDGEIIGGSTLARRQSLEEEAFHLHQKHGNTPHPDIAFNLFELSILCFEEGDYNAARQHAESSLAIYRQIHGDAPHQDIAATLHQLSVIFCSDGDLHLARQHAESSLAMQRQNHGDAPHRLTAVILHQLSEICRAEDDLHGARQHAESSLAMERQIHGDAPHSDIVKAFHELSMICHAEGDLHGARQHAESSLAMEKRIHGVAPHRDIAAILHQLSVICTAEGDLHGARQHAESSLAMKQQIHGDAPHPEIAVTLHQLSVICTAEGDLHAAQQHAESSLSMNRQIHGDAPHTDIAATLHELNMICHAAGDLHGARQHAESSLAMERQNHGDAPHSDIAVRLHQLSVIYRAGGDFHASRQHAESSLAMLQQNHGDAPHPGIAATLHQLSTICVAEGDLHGARQHAESSLSMNRQIHGDAPHPDMTVTLRDLSLICRAEGDLHAARQHAESCLSMNRQIHGDAPHPDIAATLHELGVICHAAGDLHGARQHAESSLAMTQQIHGDAPHPDIAAALHQLSMICTAAGDLHGARQHAESSLAMERQIHGDASHPEIYLSLT